MKPDEVRCMDCGSVYVPGLENDFYTEGDDPKIGRCEKCMVSKILSPRPSPVIISEETSKEICKRGQGEDCCRYLMNNGGNWNCGKGSNFEAMINEKAGTMSAKSNNCSGPPNFT